MEVTSKNDHFLTKNQILHCHLINSLESTEDCAKSIEECLSACDTESIKRAGNLFLNNKFDLRENFVALTNQKLGAEVSKVDFTNSISAAGIINGWVSEKTDGLIKEIISPEMISESMLMTLVTAILFKGKWIKKFVDSGEGIFYKKSLENESLESLDKESFEEAIRSFLVRTNFMQLSERNLFGYYKDENKTQVRVHRIVQWI